MTKYRFTSQARLFTMIVSVIISASFVLVAGCSTFPTEGPVMKSDSQGSRTQLLSQEALGPAQNSSPQRLVTDFLRACSAGAFDDYAVAREYMLPKAAEKWNPEESISIASNGQDISVEHESRDTVVVKAELKAVIDDQGKRKESDKTYLKEIKLAKNKSGQYRIAQLPPGIIIQNRLFYNAYVLRNIYFMSLDKEVLVPDPRWVPRKRMVSHLIEFLGKGPSESLKSTVMTAFPEGRDYVENIDLTDSVAHIDLNPLAAHLTQRQRSEMLWQFDQTLRQAEGVKEVELSIGSKPITQQLPKTVEYDLTSVIGMSDKSIAVNDLSGMHVLWRNDDPHVEISSPAVSPVGESPIAAVRDNSSIIQVIPGAGGNDATKEIFSAPNVLPPSVDRCGWIWSGQQGSILDNKNHHVPTKWGRVVAIKPDEKMIDMSQQTHGPELGRPKAAPLGLVTAKVSIDGSRLAAVSVDDNGKSTLHVMTIRRSKDCEPENIVRELTIDLTVINASQLTWSSPTAVAVVGEYGDHSDDTSNTHKPPQTSDPLAVEAVQLGGEHSIVNVRSDMESVYGGGTSDSLYLVNNKGIHYKLFGTQWRKYTEGLHQAGFPG